jgi:adenylate cyclase
MPSDDGYPVYSFADVLDGKVGADKFKDKIVLVGGTATALFDIRATPYLPIYYGVLIHANVIDNLIAGNYLRPLSGGMAALLVLALGLLMGLVLPRLSPWGQVATTLAVGGLGAVSAMALFTHRFVVLPVVPLLLTALVSYASVTFDRLLSEEREKRKIKGSFRQYLSPKIIDIITKDPSKLRLGGEEREVSVFFLDIAGFTTMSEALKPAQLVEVMNSCLTEFSRIILKHDGLINKYIGDCIMAFWNAPADQPGHAAMACRAALECISILPDINRRFQERGLPRIDCRVGINTGTVVVGNMGSDERFDYTVMGDPVNLASRLEGANKSYHTHIMISDTTFEQAREAIEARDLDLIRVKGKKEPRKVFEVLCRKGEMSEELTEGRKRYHNALALYRQKSFEEAIEAFQSVFDYLPNDHVTRVYLERARAFTSHPPPPAWDGVYEMMTK